MLMLSFDMLYGAVLVMFSYYINVLCIKICQTVHVSFTQHSGSTRLNAVLIAKPDMHGSVRELVKLRWVCVRLG